MTDPTSYGLPFDIARCSGVGYEEEDGFYWREGCEDCLRRLSPGKEYGQTNMMPPTIITFECEYRITANDLDNYQQIKTKQGKLKCKRRH